MIRYEITPKELEERIGKESKTWLAAAKKKTAAFRKAKKYNEKSGAWSRIKQVYMDLQFGKCAYCERQFGQDKESRIEHDVEHFRPKSSIKSWPPASRKLKYGFSTGPASATGYYLLAYKPLNYMVACKKCNSPYKSNCFPIADSKRRLDTEDFAKLALERPFLIYPISNIDDDPETLIWFEGVLPAPKASETHRRRRGRVTIDFFALHTREELLRERALLIKTIYVAWSELKSKDELRRRDAEQTIDQIDEPRLPHRNCARSFYAVCRKDGALARQYYEAAIDYLDSVGFGRTGSSQRP